MSPRFVLGRENVPCAAEVVNRSFKADCTDFTSKVDHQVFVQGSTTQKYFPMNESLLLLIY